MGLRSSYVYFFLFVSLVAAVLAVGFGLGYRKKGCYCPSQSKGSTCCKKDPSVRVCQGKCVCKVTEQGDFLPRQCRKEHYGLEGLPVVITTISASVAGISFVVALVCGALMCMWSEGPGPEAMVQLPKPYAQQKSEKYPSATHAVEDKTISL